MKKLLGLIAFFASVFLLSSCSKTRTCMCYYIPTILSEDYSMPTLEELSQLEDNGAATNAQCVSFCWKYVYKNYDGVCSLD